jgi:hypothetical protein
MKTAMMVFSLIALFLGLAAASPTYLNATDVSPNKNGLFKRDANVRTFSLELTLSHHTNPH